MPCPHSARLGTLSVHCCAYPREMGQKMAEQRRGGMPEHVGVTGMTQEVLWIR